MSTAKRALGPTDHSTFGSLTGGRAVSAWQSKQWFSRMPRTSAEISALPAIPALSGDASSAATVINGEDFKTGSG